MRKRLLSGWLLALWLGLTGVLAQSVEDRIQEGRALLAQRQYAAAEAKFEAATTLAPTHELANVLRAFSRVLALPERPAVRSALDRAGLAPTNRNFLSWSAELPHLPDGTVNLPANMSGAELMEVQRNEVVPTLLAAEANLSRVHDPNFAVALTAEETTTVATVVDYADVQLLRALCHGLAYLSLTLNAWDWNAPLQAIGDFLQDPDRSVEAFLAAHPHWFQPAVGADLDLARASLRNLTTQFEVASGAIRARPLVLDRLFNWDEDLAGQEALFREILVALRDSLERTVPLPGAKGLSIRMERQFAPTFAPRPLAPEFDGNELVLGTLPDPTFGGLITGPSGAEVEEWLLELLGGSGVPRLGALALGASTTQLRQSAQLGRAYVLEASADLVLWTPVARQIAQQLEVTWEIPTGGPRSFYRIRELEPLPNDRFADRQRLSGDAVEWWASFAGAGREPQEPSSIGGDATLWWEWTPAADGFALLEEMSGTRANLGVFQGTDLAGLTRVGTPPSSGSVGFRVVAGRTYFLVAAQYDLSVTVHLRLRRVLPPANDLRAQAQVLTGENAAADGSTAGAAAEGDDPPLPLPFSYPTVWYAWTAPSAGRYRVQLSSPRGSSGLAVYQVPTSGSLLRLEMFGSEETGLNALVNRSYLIAVYEPTGGGSDFHLEISRVTPPANDDFGSAVVLAGSSATSSGSTLVAGNEVGEPAHPVPSARGTVWYAWKAPSDGMVDVKVDSDSQVALVVYQGTSLAQLTLVNAELLLWDPSALRFPTAAGTEYRIAVVRQLNVGGPFHLEVAVHAPPPNDEYANRIPLSGRRVVAEGSSRYSTDRSSVWWSWTAPAAGELRVELERLGFEAELSLLREGTVLASVPNGLSVRVFPNFTYDLRVQADSPGEEGRFVLRLGFDEPPVNDAFATRLKLEGQNVSVTGANFASSLELGEPAHILPGGRSVWWTWTAPVSGLVTIDTAGSTFNSAVAVYTGNALNQLVGVFQIPSGQSRSIAETRFPGKAGTTYQIAVDGYQGDVGEVDLKLRAPGSPAFEVEPVGGKVFSGANFRLSAPAVGEPPLKFQWYRNGQPLPGPQGPEWNVVGAVPGDSGNYHVVVSNAFGVITSRVAVMEVGTPPPNDRFANRTPIVGNEAHLQANSRFASAEVSDPGIEQRFVGGSMWWTWTATQNAEVTIDTFQSSFDTLLGVFEGTTLATLKLVAENDDAVESTSRLSFLAVAGHSYQILVGGYGGGAGEFFLNFVAKPKP